MSVESATPSIRSYEERAVLAKYATGTDLAAIEDARGHDWVAGVVMRVAGMDRGRARAAVLAWDDRMSTQGGRRAKEAEADPPAAARPAKAPAKVAAAAKPALEKRVVEPVKATAVEAEPVKPTPAPAPTPAAPEPPRELVMPADIEALLKDAEQSGLARLVEKAGRIRHHIHELNAMVASSEKERVLRATIRVLNEQRLKAIDELKELTGKTDVRVSVEPLTAEQRAEIRRWARAQGMTVSDTGRLQKTVVDAWRAATTS